MKKRPLWPLLALALAISACTCPEVKTSSVAGTPRPGAPATDRNCKTGDSCVVWVDVADCSAKGGTTVDASQLGILTGTHDLDISWVIRTPGYEFTREGVAFKNDSYRKEFVHPRRPVPNIYVWTDLNNAGGDPFRTYPYGVAVAKTSGAPCVPLDPTIVNDL